MSYEKQERERHDADVSKMAGNMAAMREALVNAKHMIDVIGNASIGIKQTCTELSAMIESALAAPPRNCDVGTPEEQAKRFCKYCNSHKCVARSCKVRPYWEQYYTLYKCAIVSCGSIWALLPYEEGGAKWTLKN